MDAQVSPVLRTAGTRFAGKLGVGGDVGPTTKAARQIWRRCSATVS
jgi:hypothetical protein